MYRRAIWTYYLLTSCIGLCGALPSAIYATFLRRHGLNALEVNLINVAFFATLLIFEVPTGALADLWGRKRSYVLACFLIGLGAFIYGIGSSVWLFILSEVTCGLGSTMANGAFQAWIIQIQIQSGHPNLVGQTLGKDRALRSLTLIAGGSLGAYLSGWSLHLPFKAMAGVAWLTAVLALILMYEPSRSNQKHVDSTKHVSNLDRLRQTVQLTLNLSRNHRTIKLVLGLTFCLSIATMGPNMQWQPWYQQFSFFTDTRRLGLIAVLVGISLGFGAILSHRVVISFGARQALLLSQILVGVGLLLAIWSKGLAFGLPGFLLHELARGAFDPIQKTYLSSHAKESERATLLSLGSVPAHLGGVIGLLLSGILALKGSIALSWVGSGFLLLGAAWWLARKLPA